MPGRRCERAKRSASRNNDQVAEFVVLADIPVTAETGGLVHFCLSGRYFQDHATHWGRPVSSAGMPSGVTGKVTGGVTLVLMTPPPPRPHRGDKARPKPHSIALWRARRLHDLVVRAPLRQGQRTGRRDLTAM